MRFKPFLHYTADDAGISENAFCDYCICKHYVNTATQTLVQLYSHVKAKIIVSLF